MLCSGVTNKLEFSINYIIILIVRTKSQLEWGPVPYPCERNCASVVAVIMDCTNWTDTEDWVTFIVLSCLPDVGYTFCLVYRVLCWQLFEWSFLSVNLFKCECGIWTLSVHSDVSNQFVLCTFVVNTYVGLFCCSACQLHVLANILSTKRARFI